MAANLLTAAVAIPSIPPRRDLLARALTSVAMQTRPADEIVVAIDHNHDSAAITRNRAWRMTTSDLVAFLDDDDEYEPSFIAETVACLQAHDADLVFPYYTVIGGTDPYDYFGVPWDPDNPRQTTIACLWRRSALEKVGGFPEPGDNFDKDGNRAGEDYLAVCRLNDQGGRIVHLPARLYRYHHHDSNTSGHGCRW